MQQYCNDQPMSQPGTSDDNKYQQQQRFLRQPTQPSQQTTKSKQYHHRMSTSSEDDATIQDPNENTWQKVKTTKRRKVNQPLRQNLTLSNKYSQLNVEDDENTTTTTVIENKIQKPPPIFVYGVTNYQDMVHNLCSSIATINK